MIIGLPAIGSFQTVDGIRFVAEEPGLSVLQGKAVRWNGGPRGGCIIQTAPIDSDRRYESRGVHTTSFVKAATRSIKGRKNDYLAALKLVADYEAAGS